MSDNKVDRVTAMSIYTPPFKHVRGYIYDSKKHMVADSGDVVGEENVKSAVASRVRGWGRITYMPDAAALQDAVGDMMAVALNRLYASEPTNFFDAQRIAEKHNLDYNRFCSAYKEMLETAGSKT